jgi:hypothetical protein
VRAGGGDGKETACNPKETTGDGKGTTFDGK